MRRWLKRTWLLTRFTTLWPDTAAGWTRPGIYLPLWPKTTQKGQLAEFEQREKKTLVLNPTAPRVAEYETQWQMRVDEVKKDFLGGQKSTA